MPEILELGTRFRTVTSKVETIAFSSGGVSSLELPRSFLLKNLYLRLSGTATVAVAAAASLN